MAPETFAWISRVSRLIGADNWGGASDHLY